MMLVRFKQATTTASITSLLPDLRQIVDVDVLSV